MFDDIIEKKETCPKCFSENVKFFHGDVTIDTPAILIGYYDYGECMDCKFKWSTKN